MYFHSAQGLSSREGRIRDTGPVKPQFTTKKYEVLTELLKAELGRFSEKKKKGRTTKSKKNKKKKK